MEMIIPRRRTTRTRPVYALYSRTKWYLMIKPDGTVSATQDRNNRYAWISFSATGVGLAYIQGVETGLFLAMNEEGELYTTILLENNSSFETMIEDSYQAYSPVTQPHNRNSNNKWYLGIDKQGRVKKSENRCSRSAQFLAIGVF
ncbi:fibroblast growth factor 13-like [Glandiceps talaboti]